MMIQTPPPQPAVSFIELPAAPSSAALRDLDGDGRLDLVSLEEPGLRVFLQRADGTFPAEPDTDFSWPSEPLAWDLIEWTPGAATSLSLLDGEGELALYGLVDGHLAKARVLLEDAAVFLPRGTRRMRFVRDCDGDGELDLIVPGPGVYSIHLGTGEGFRPPIQVAFEARISTRTGDPASLTSRFGQYVFVPWFSIEDVDGDGLTDLWAETRDEVRFYLAAPDLPKSPTWTLDLRALRASVPKKQGIDLEDLLSNVTANVRWSIEELDGEPPAELVIQTVDTLKIYAGGSRTGIGDQASKVLRASGPILYTFLRDVTGDGLRDLQLVRSETVSLGRVIRWLVFPGKLDFDLYTYTNVDGSFGLKPSKKTTFSLKIPRLLFAEDDFEELGDELEAREEVPARVLALDADGLRDDVADLREGRLELHANRRPEGYDEELPGFRDGDLDRMIEFLLLEDMDALDDGDVREFGIDDVLELRFSTGHDLREACRGSTPRFAVPFELPVEDPELATTDLDGDGTGDVVLWGRDERGSLRLQLVVLP